MNTVAEKKMADKTKDQNTLNACSYGCEILFERATLQQVKDPSLPSDAYIVIYEIDNQSHMDLCRGTRVRIFDMYYDKYGPGSLKKITWGYGKVNPKIWGYKSPEKKKRR